MFKSTNLSFYKSLIYAFKYAYATMPTFQRYPYIKKYKYNEVKIKDIDYFKSILTNEQVLTDEQIIVPYNIDWLKECKGSSKLVLRPKNTLQISNILKYCNEYNLALVPQGGNTGLVHGSIPAFDEIILSLSLMNHIESIDNLSGVLICQAGCILKQLDDYASQNGYIVPLDLGAKGSCQIGGNLATNAGGIRLLRYGPLRGSVLGLKAVLADGSVLDCMNTMRKDNTGYDLKQLLIGSEGTLGIITKVAIQCQSRPLDTNVAFFGCESFETIIRAYTMAKTILGETISAFEFMDRGSMDAVTKKLDYRNPLCNNLEKNPDLPFYFLTECAGCNAEHNLAKMSDFVTAILDMTDLNKNNLIEGTLSNSTRGYREIWRMREEIYTAMVPLYASMGATLVTYDISLPIKRWPDLVKACQKVVSSVDGMVTFCGHFGDQNVHVNVMLSSKPSGPKDMHTAKEELDNVVYQDFPKTLKNYHEYSISAEHGIGLIKRAQFHKLYRNNVSSMGNEFGSMIFKNRIDVMKDIKALLDPKNILNPYKIFEN